MTNYLSRFFTTSIKSDLRIYKKVNNGSILQEDYYLMDAMGKTIAIRSKNGNNTPTWSYFVSAAAREMRLVPNANQQPGANTSNATSVQNVVFQTGQQTVYVYDHSGNTRFSISIFNPQNNII